MLDGAHGLHAVAGALGGAREEMEARALGGHRVERLRGVPQRQRALAAALEEAGAPVVRGAAAEATEGPVGHVLVEARERRELARLVDCTLRHLERIGARGAARDAAAREVECEPPLADGERGAPGVCGNRGGVRVVRLTVDQPCEILEREVGPGELDEVERHRDVAAPWREPRGALPRGDGPHAVLGEIPERGPELAPRRHRLLVLGRELRKRAHAPEERVGPERPLREAREAILEVRRAQALVHGARDDAHLGFVVAHALADPSEGRVELRPVSALGAASQPTL